MRGASNRGGGAGRGPEGQLRVCLVTREYPALGAHGGIGTYTRNLATGLAARGHDVVVLAHGEARAAFEDGGALVVPVPAPERWRLPAGNGRVGMTMRALPFLRAAGARFRGLQRQAPFDVVEIPEYQGWGLGVALAARCPVVVRLHSHTRLVRRLNDTPLDFDARLCERLEIASLRRGDALLSNSAALARVVETDFGTAIDPARLGVLPLGIDAERFAPSEDGRLRAELGLASDEPLVLYVGRLERRKGVETLIEAWLRLRWQQPRAVLALAGFSTETGAAGRAMLDQLRETVHAAGGADRVRFLGHVPYDELPSWYASADLVVAPSHFEPFGMIYLEAMACGRVAVGCTAGGVPEIVRHGRTGYMVPPGDAEALAAAMAELLRYPSWRRRIGAAARQEVLARFALPVIAARTEAAYRAAIATHDGGPALAAA